MAEQPSKSAPTDSSAQRLKSARKRSSDMANIGSFKKIGNEFQGEVQAKGVRIVPETVVQAIACRSTMRSGPTQ
jgi:hypothetical protein